MFVSRKEHEELRKEVTEQGKVIHDLMHELERQNKLINTIIQNLNEKQDDEPAYFG